MKKASIFFIALFFGIALNGFSQTAQKDFFVGKWEVTILETPNGDSKMIVNISRRDGSLIGEIINPEEPNSAAVPLTNVEETNDKLVIYFNGGGMDLSIPLEKVDNDNLKGKLLEMFEVKAKRIK